MTLEQDKKALRQVMRRQKSYITDAIRKDAAASVFYKLEHLREYAEAKNILIYYSLPDELPTHHIIDVWQAEKNIFLPQVVGDNIEIARYRPGALRKGDYNIMEPEAHDRVDVSQLDLIVVPGVAFDACGHRLGRGRGYYDRLLSQSGCRAKTVGVAFDFQVASCVPSEARDVSMDIVISESKLYFCQ